SLAILQGMNRHGRLAIANLAGSIISVCAVVWVLIEMKFGLLEVAMAATVPLLLVNAIYAPIHTCRCIGLPWGSYVTQTFVYALVRTLPFGACLLGARWVFGDHIRQSLLVGGLVGTTVMVPMYWRNVLPPSIKCRLTAKFGLEKTSPPESPNGQKIATIQ